MPCGPSSACADADLADDEAHRPGAEPGAERATGSTRSTSSYHSPLMRALQHAQLHVREAHQPHGRFAGPAPPHGAGVAAAADVRRHARARLRHAAADRGQPGRAGRVRRADAAGVGRQEPAARARRAARVRALRAAQRQGGPLHRDRARSSRSLHKWTMRTCFNAQEEIYQASMDEVEQVRARASAAGRGTSGRRASSATGWSRPRCTEGTHFCGVPGLAELAGRGAAGL